MSKTILIVDDNEPTRKLLAAIVEEQEGYQALTAEDGYHALDLAKNNHIDCALIDQYMEPINGFNLALSFQADNFKFPMIMITANDGSDLLSMARRHGFTTTLMKPVKPEHLLKLLERVCH